MQTNTQENMRVIGLIQGHEPKEVVSCLQWVSDDENKLSFVAGSYDGFIHLFELDIGNQIFFKSWELKFPCAVSAIEVKFPHLFVGLGDGKILLGTLKSDNFEPIGQHEGPVCRITFVSYLYTFGTDRKFFIYDLTKNKRYEIILPLKTFAVGYNTNHFIIGSEQFSLTIISAIDDIDYEKMCLKKQLEYVKLKAEYPQEEIRCLCYCNNEKLIWVGTMKGVLFLFKYNESKINFIESMSCQKFHSQVGMISDIETGYDPTNGHFSIYAGTFQSKILCEKMRKPFSFSSKDGIPVTALKFNKTQEYLIYAVGDDWFDEVPRNVSVKLFVQRFEYASY